METAPGQLQQELLLAQMGWVRGLARSLVGDSALAEDITQEAWLAASGEGTARFDGEAGLRAWLVTVVRNLANKSRRSSSRRLQREVHSARAEATESTADLVARGALHRDLATQVMRLEEPYRSTILLRYLDDLPTAEVARRLGIEPATARKRISRGLERMRTSMDAEYGGDRGAWTMALVPLLDLGPAANAATQASAWALPGTIAMQLKALVALLTLSLFALYHFSGRESLTDINEAGLLSEAADSSAIAGGQAQAEDVGQPASSRVADSRPGLEVLDANGLPLADALAIFLSEDQLLMHGRTDAAGRLALPDGLAEYSVLIAKRGRMPELQEFAQSNEDQVFQLARGVELAGRLEGVSSPERLELVLASDHPCEPLAGLGEEVSRLLAEEGSGLQRLSVQPALDGSYVFAGLRSDWTGAMLAPKGTRFSTTPVEGALRERHELLLLDPPGWLPLSLERLVVLRGQVVERTSRELVPELMLAGRVASDGGRRHTIDSVLTDARGSFEIELPLAEASDEGWTLELHGLDQSLLDAKWSFDSTELKESTDLGQLELSLGDTVRFLVQDSAGAPVVGARGTLMESRAHSEATDAYGSAHVRGLHGPKGTLVVTAPGFALAEVPVEAGVDALVVMEPSNSLHIQVRRAGGEPCDDLAVQVLGEEHTWEGSGPLGWMEAEVSERRAKRARRLLEQPRPLESDGTCLLGPLRANVQLEVRLLDGSGRVLESRTIATPGRPGLSEVIFDAPASTGFFIVGEVRTPEGRPLPRAKVHIENQGFATNLFSDARGGFSSAKQSAPLSGVLLEVTRPGFVTYQLRDASFDDLTVPLEVTLEPARTVEVELRDAAGRAISVSYLEARLAGGGLGAALPNDRGSYTFDALPLRVGELVAELGGVEYTTALDASQTHLNMELPAMAWLEVQLAEQLELASGARVCLTWTRMTDGEPGTEQRKYFRASREPSKTLGIDLPEGEYVIQLEQRVLSKRLVERLGEPRRIELVAGEARSLTLP